MTSSFPLLVALLPGLVLASPNCDKGCRQERAQEIWDRNQAEVRERRILKALEEANEINRERLRLERRREAEGQRERLRQH